MYDALTPSVAEVSSTQTPPPALVGFHFSQVRFSGLESYLLGWGKEPTAQSCTVSLTSTVISWCFRLSKVRWEDDKNRWCNKRRLAKTAGNWPRPRPVWEEEEGDGCFIQHDPVSDQILPRLAIRDKNSCEHICKLDEALPHALLDTPISLLHGRHNVGVSSHQNPAVGFCRWLGTGWSKALGAATLRNICCWEVPV